jgi:hypothetical protein
MYIPRGTLRPRQVPGVGLSVCGAFDDAVGAVLTGEADALLTGIMDNVTAPARAATVSARADNPALGNMDM